MIRFRRTCIFVLLFALVFVFSKAPRTHAAGRQTISSGPSRRDIGFFHSYATHTIGSGEFEPEKRKIPTGSNPLHNKR
ncbi:hypothetical protein BRARA_E01158 [Brassica rapa]|uniref:Uncharacterized protein n=2 Tax=Brassica campestris TaxID=3711 RepID=A0A397ZI69_BRACM|nr:hypothetical protein IGI04_018419 [Brassica rapa subsp. trilocularis]RID62063.1 hypothetical protein BRARA_E01158 [Brassica rapa]